MWGTTVGAVAWDATRSVAAFEYAEGFRRSGLEVAPLQMPLRPGTFRFPNLGWEAFHGLPGMLADSLPDRWGTRLVNAWLDAQGRPRESFSPVERLCYIGPRGMGALEYRPAMRGLGRSEAVDVDHLADLAREVLEDRIGFSTDLDDDGLEDLLQVGTSAGGMRAKAVIAWEPTTGAVRSGQVRAPEGFEYWLLKFDIGSSDRTLGDPQGWGRLEYAYHRMATRAGVTMMPARLHVDAAGRAHFMTKRFDRTDGGDRLHTQTMQAIAHADYNEPGAFSWEEALRITLRLCGASDAGQLFRRMVFNVIARNQDDHTKNISLVMDRTGTWSLAPAYDVMFAHNPHGPWTAVHQMTIAGKRDGISRQDLLTVADRLGIRSAGHIIDEVTDAVRDWRTFSNTADVDPDLSEAVEATHRLDIGP